MQVFFRSMEQYDPVSGNKRNVQRVGPDPIVQRLSGKRACGEVCAVRSVPRASCSVLCALCPV